MLDYFGDERFVLLFRVLLIQYAVGMLLHSRTSEQVMAVEAVHAVEGFLAVPDEHPAEDVVVLFQVAAIPLQLAVIEEVAVLAVAIILAHCAVRTIL